MDKQQQEQPIDLSKTVPISPQEEAKLADFLKRMQAGIEGDSELEAIRRKESIFSNATFFSFGFNVLLDEFFF